MKFVTIRDFRSGTAAIRRDLAREQEIVLTANGRPIAIISPTDADTVEEYLLALRRARARLALDRIRARARARGLDRLGADEIEAVVSEVRRGKRSRS